MSEEKVSKAAELAAKYRMSTDYKAQHGVTTQLMVVDCSTPNGDDYLRCQLHEDDAVIMPCLKLKGEKAVYLVGEDVAEHLREWTYAAHMVQCVTRYGRSFIWAVRLPDSDSKENRYSESCVKSAKTAADKWVQIRWSKVNMCYECRSPDHPIEVEPEWPKESFLELIGMAFSGCTIDDLDHPVAKQLLGRS